MGNYDKSKVVIDPVTGCWVWVGARYADGYARLRRDGRYVRGHRWIYEGTYGPLPEDVVVRHVVCDNPPCLNLDHLAAGTQRDNLADMVEKGRTTTRLVMLDEDRVREIRSALDQGVSRNGLSKKFGVSRRTIQDIDQRRTWREVA